jgi:chemotaxis signal transduction protein
MSDAVAIPPEAVVEEEQPHIPTRRLLVFNIGGSSFACEMDAFREIVPMQHITRLPGRPTRCVVSSTCAGRASRTTRPSLGKQARSRAEGLILLVDYFDRWIGIGVDDVRDIQDVPIDQFGSADQAEIPLVGAVTGAVEIEGERVLVLDIKTVVQKVIGQGR